MKITGINENAVEIAIVNSSELPISDIQSALDLMVTKV